MSSVIFGDQGVDEVYDCAGATVGMFKQRLRDSHNIPYFADAIVNGEIVPVAYVLGDGDRLCFRKRFGVKGGDDRPFEEREADGLIHAYGLAEIVSAVKLRNLSKDESLDLMAVMVGQWANRNFGPPDQNDGQVLDEILKRLTAIEDQHRATGSDQVGLTVREQDILEALGDKTMTGEELAKAAGYEYDGHFKGILSSLVKRGILFNARPGYRKTKSGPSQD